MNEIIALHERLAARRGKQARAPFTLSRVDGTRFRSMEKGPPKHEELRSSRPIARLEAVRLRPVAERFNLADRVSWRARRAADRVWTQGAGKLRLFRLWKIFGDKAAVEAAPDTLGFAPARPLAERLAWLKRTRRT